MTAKPTPALLTETVSVNPKFWAMVKAAESQRKWNPQERPIVAFDPGETTGMAIWLPWKPNELVLKQVRTPEVVEGYLAIKAEMPNTDIKMHAVMEDYRVYGWKADDHKWAGLHTPQLIGALKIMLHHYDATVQMRMAQQAKQWATDEKLKFWGCYNAGMKHARDAQRHLITTLFYG